MLHKYTSVIPISTFATIGTIAGIFTQNGSIAALFGIVPIILFTIAKKYFNAPLCLFFTFASVGSFVVSIKQQQLATQQRQLAQIKYIKKLSGVVIDRHSSTERIWQDRLTIAVEETSPRTTLKQVAIYTKNSVVEPGTYISCKNLRVAPLPKDMALYCAKNHIDCCFFTKTVTQHFPRYSSFLQKGIDKVKAKLSTNTFAAWAAIFLGKREDHNENLIETCRHWGTMHFLARSGLHLVLLMSIVGMTISLLSLPLFWSHLALLLFISLYVFYSWTAPPIIRSFVVACLWLLCKLANLQTHSLHLLNLACIGMLLYNPVQLFFLDFQLSFALTYALLIFSQLVQQR